jgi:UDP-N-acetylglucosamine transferase subunit ALG13
VIFVTVGTHQQPFERLLRALDGLKDDLVVQFGHGRPPATAARAEAFMPFDAMLAAFEEADTVITHAGVGSVLCATRAGHLPIVVPRRPELGEHVDGHQAELTRALGERGSVVPVWDMAALPEAVVTATSRRSPTEHREASLCPNVKQALLGR